MSSPSPRGSGSPCIPHGQGTRLPRADVRKRPLEGTVGPTGAVRRPARSLRAIPAAPGRQSASAATARGGVGVGASFGSTPAAAPVCGSTSRRRSGPGTRVLPPRPPCGSSPARPARGPEPSRGSRAAGRTRGDRPGLWASPAVELPHAVQLRGLGAGQDHLPSQLHGRAPGDPHRGPAGPTQPADRVSAPPRPVSRGRGPRRQGRGQRAHWSPREGAERRERSETTEAWLGTLAPPRPAPRAGRPGLRMCGVGSGRVTRFCRARVRTAFPTEPQPRALRPQPRAPRAPEPSRTPPPAGAPTPGGPRGRC